MLICFLPSRLGYLFSGPPGTGKSSLAFALAGHFGLPVYVLSLSLPQLTDKGLEELFASTPFHCILLLEDVDATEPLTRAGSRTRAPTKDEDKKKKSTVTLSGLLNAIDGVAAAEGEFGNEPDSSDGMHKIILTWCSLQGAFSS